MIVGWRGHEVHGVEGLVVVVMVGEVLWRASLFVPVRDIE
jgi:hypothetical protein